jgi:hypothetical protein
MDPRDLAWIEGTHELGGLTLRPITWGSLLLADLMELTILQRSGSVSGLSKEEAEAQISLILWMQSAPIPTVLQCVRDGTWGTFRVILKPQASSSEPESDFDLLASVLLWIQSQSEALLASRFSIAGPAGKALPFPPHWIARKVHLLTKERGWSAHHVLWELPLAQAEQIEQCILITLGHRTTSPKGAAGSAAKQLEQAEVAIAQTAEDQW